MTAKFLFIKNKIVNDEKRIKFNIRADLDSIEHFMVKLASKFESFTFTEAKDDNNEPEEEQEEPRNGIGSVINGINDDETAAIAYNLKDLIISYSILNDGRHVPVANNEEFIELIESHCEVAAKEFIIKEFIISKAGDTKLVKVLPDKTVAALESQVLKLAINNIPYKFSGSNDENIHYYIYHLLGFCTNNNITIDVIIKLLLNGTVLKGAAFEFIETQRDEINKLKELNKNDELEGIFDLLRNQFRCENLIITLRSEITQLKQGNMVLKDYIRGCDKLFKQLTLEIAIQAANGNTYKDLNEIEKADACLKGMNKDIRSAALDKAIDQYDKVQVTFKQLKELLVKLEKKELYLKSLDCNIKLTRGKPMIINQINASPSKKQLKTTIDELKEEINFIKLGNQKLYGRGDTLRGNNNNHGDTLRGNNNNHGYHNNYLKKIPMSEKKKNGECSYGKMCRFGVLCRFLHNDEEWKFFWNNNIGTNGKPLGRNNNNNRGGRGGRGRGGGRGNGNGRFSRINAVDTQQQQNQQQNPLAHYLNNNNNEAHF